MDTVLQNLQATLRRRALELSSFSPAAAQAFAEAADEAERALTEFLAERLLLSEAAGEYGWTYEGLRRRIAAEPTLAEKHGNGPATVTRATMSQLGRGRGPRLRRTGAGDPPRSSCAGAAPPPLKSASADHADEAYDRLARRALSHVRVRQNG